MVLPTIHLNGTSRERLLEPLNTAYDAINEAYTALKQCAPNGRDYYPQGQGAMDNAVKEHMARLQRLDDVSKELEAIINAIS